MLIITGMSGAGKSVALNFLEDLGYYCVDNLPIVLLDVFVQEFARNFSRPIAVAIDVRNTENLASIAEKIKAVKSKIPVQVLFLTAKDEILLQRFSETRRPHPLHQQSGQTNNITTLIHCEREQLGDLNNIADILLDTSFYSASDLRQRLAVVLACSSAKISLCLQSFGFKNGLPINADFVFDARFLPNPYWIKEIRHYAGNQKPVRDWLDAQELAQKFVRDIANFFSNYLDCFMEQASNRAYLNICVGCTGGQHRSVYVVEKLREFLEEKFPLSVEHRDVKIYKGE